MVRFTEAQLGLIPVVKEHQSLLSRLTEDLSRNPVGRSYLFTGPSGVGKKQAAHSLAQFLLCQNYPRVCGSCPACLRVEKSAHESLLFVDPAQNQIRIEEARRILDFLSLQSLSRFRVVLIDQAHRLNAAAANSLLKVLEEPPPDSFFFLITSSPSLMLSTLRSRSLRVHFRPDSVRRSEKHSAELSQQWGQELVRFFKEADLLTVAGWRDGLKDREIYADRLSFWMELIRDALILQIGTSDFILNGSSRDVLAQLKSLPREKLLTAFETLLAFERDLVFNRDPVLMSEEFIVEMKA